VVVSRFAFAVLRSGSSSFWPHMALASHGSGGTDHVRVMQRVAGPEV